MNMNGARVEDRPNEAKEKILSLLQVFAKGPEYSNTLEEEVGCCCSGAAVSPLDAAPSEKALVGRWALNRDRMGRVARERKLGTTCALQV